MKKRDNFQRALKNLEGMNEYQEPYDAVILSGLVALYEICFEQAWKAMKERMLREGVASAASGSPRSIIKDAYCYGILAEEELWLEALQARNNVAHAYNEKIALDIVKRTREVYLDLFKRLDTALEERWAEEG